MIDLALAALMRHPSLSLVAIAILFALLEIARPLQGVDRRRDFRHDLIGAIAGAAFVVLSYGALLEVFAAIDGTALLRARQALHGLPAWIRILAVVLCVDFAIYWLHAAMHRWDVAWRMHRWHHAVEQMYWFAGFRASLLHILLYGIPQVLIPVFVFELGAGETLVAAAIGNLVQVWTHANVRLDIGRLQWLLVTPRYHLVHHRAGAVPARNLGNLLTIWDRCFGTYEAPGPDLPDRLGLGEPRPGTLRMLLGL